MQNLEWPRGPVILLLSAIVIILVPDRLEGPVLYTINNEHAVSLLDAFAMVPLFFSLVWIQREVWKRRIYLFNNVTLYPGSAVLIVFTMGIGLGMFLASAFFTFRYWWAVGGSAFIIMMILVVLISGKAPR